MFPCREVTLITRVFRRIDGEIVWRWRLTLGSLFFFRHHDGDVAKLWRNLPKDWLNRKFDDQQNSQIQMSVLRRLRRLRCSFPVICRSFSTTAASGSKEEGLPKPAAKTDGGFIFAETLEAEKKYFWCACGLSQKQPFCDGAHKGTGFKSTHFTVSESKTYNLCGCKHTKTPPYCDAASCKVLFAKK